MVKIILILHIVYDNWVLLWVCMVQNLWFNLVFTFRNHFIKLFKSQPISRMVKPEKIVYLALHLCLNEATFITGNDFYIDVGFT